MINSAEEFILLEIVKHVMNIYEQPEDASDLV
jgi:hypothetical protein